MGIHEHQQPGGDARTPDTERLIESIERRVEAFEAESGDPDEPEPSQPAAER